MATDVYLDDDDPRAGASALSDDARESVALGNLSSVAGQPSALADLALLNLVNNINASQQNAVSNQQAMNQVALATTGRVVNLVAGLSPLEALAVGRLYAGINVARQLAELKGSIAALSAAQT
ncbi:MAG TPA: hypothetical protein VF668_13365 [Pyrinomonadaceae bacterium]